MKHNERIEVVLHPSLGNQLGSWNQYQAYYAMGLSMLPHVQFRYASLVDRTLASVRARGWRGAYAGWRLAAKFNADLRYERATFVGRYTIQFPDREAPVRVAIDAHDDRSIRDPEAYDWSDVYFKVSHWPSLDYGPKAQPLICGNGALNHERIARLIRLRNQPRDLDLVFIAKLWAGHPGATFWNSIEHVVRTFETLAKLKIRSHLRATVMPLGRPFPRRFLERLSNAGVPVTTNEVTVDELWNVTSASRLAFLRPGRHLTLSWRMIDHLAMGACTVFDHAPYPEWPVALQAGREFMDCECGMGMDDSLHDPACYERMADTVMALLADPERVAESRRAAAAYFDQHVAPERIAQYLLDAVRSPAKDEARLRPRQPDASHRSAQRGQSAGRRAQEWDAA
jgi:hypothetical protein